MHVAGPSAARKAPHTTEPARKEAPKRGPAHASAPHAAPPTPPARAATPSVAPAKRPSDTPTDVEKAKAHEQAAAHRPAAPPTTESTPADKAIDGVVDAQTAKHDKAANEADGAKVAVDANAQQQRGIDRSEALNDKPIQVAGAERRRAALISQQPDLVRQRDTTAARRDAEQRTLDVVTTTCDVVRSGAQADADHEASAAATDRSTQASTALHAAAPQLSATADQGLTTAERAALSAPQRTAYDSYARARADADLATTAEQAHQAHGLAAQARRQAQVDDPAYRTAVNTATKALDRALSPQDLRIAMPKATDQRLPGRANAGLREQVKASVADLAAKTADAATTMDAAWDADHALVASLTPDAVAARDGADPAHAAALDADVATKQAYLAARIQGPGDGAARTRLDAALAHQDALAHPEDQGIAGAATALRADADSQSARARVGALEQQAATLDADLAAHPSVQAPGRADDPRIIEAVALHSQLDAARDASRAASDALTGATLRNGFLDGLSPELRDPQTDGAKADVAQKQYEFFRDDPAALGGLDPDVQQQLRQDPAQDPAARSDGNDRLGSALEAAGGVALMALGTAADATGVGAVLGVAAQVEGANLFVHGTRDFIAGKRTDGFIAQGLEASGVSRDAARRWDAGINAAASLAGGGVGLLGDGMAAARLAAEAPSLSNVARTGAATANLALSADQAQAGMRDALFDQHAEALSTAALASTLHISPEAAQTLLTGLTLAHPLVAARARAPTAIPRGTPPPSTRTTSESMSDVMPANVRPLHSDGPPAVPPEPAGDAPLADVIPIGRTGGGDEPEPTSAQAQAEPRVMKLAAGGEDMPLAQPNTNAKVIGFPDASNAQAIKRPSIGPAARQVLSDAKQRVIGAGRSAGRWTATQAKAAVSATRAGTVSIARTVRDTAADLYHQASAWTRNAASYLWKGNSGNAGLKKVLTTNFGTPSKVRTDFLDMPTRGWDRLKVFGNMARGYTKTIGKATALVNGAGLVAGAGYEVGLREKRTAAAVTAANARDELRALQTDPDAYLRDRYDNSIAGAVSGFDLGKNIDGHLRAMTPTLESRHGDDPAYYFRRVPSDLFDALKQKQMQDGNQSDHVFVNEDVLGADGQRKTVSVEIRPPWRDEPLRDGMVVKPSPDGRRAVLNFGLGPLEGLRPHFDVDLALHERFNLPGEAARGINAGPVTTLRWQMPTVDQPKGIDIRQQTTTIDSRIALSTNVLDFNVNKAIDLDDPASITSGHEFTVGNLRAYLDIGNRNRLRTGTDFTKSIVRARETGLVELGLGEDFVRYGYNRNDYASLNAYHELQYYTPDVRLEAAYSKQGGLGFNPKVVQDLVPKAGIDSALQASWTGVPAPLGLTPPFNGPPVSNALPGQGERALPPRVEPSAIDRSPSPTPSTPPQKIVVPVYVTADGRRRATRTLWGIAEKKSATESLRFANALAQIYVLNPRFDRRRQDGVITVSPPGDPDLLHNGELVRVD